MRSTEELDLFTIDHPEPNTMPKADQYTQILLNELFF